MGISQGPNIFLLYNQTEVISKIQREIEKDRDGAIKTIWESRFRKNNKSVDRVDATTGRKGLGAGAMAPV